MGPLQFTIYAGGAALALLLAVRFVLVFVALRRLRVGCAREALLPLGEVSEAHRTVFEQAARDLVALGFEYSHCEVQTQVPAPSTSSPEPMQLFVHRAHRGWATVQASALPEQAAPYVIEFSQHYADGTILATVDCRLHFMAPDPPQQVIREARRKSAGDSDSAQIAADMLAAERIERAQPARPRGWAAKALLFVASAIAFAVSFGLTLSWQTVSILAAVILFHELGHFAGMKLFGFRDPQIFFLPFLGAATTGQKEDATAGEKLVMYVLGPLPGLLLGAVAASGSPDSLLYRVGLVALILNGLNLVPVLPFDGGRIVETLLFQRWPFVRFFFVLLSIGALAAGGWSMGEPLLAALAALFALTVPEEWHTWRALARLRRRLPVDAEPDARKRAIFEVLAEAPFRQRTAAARLVLAGSLRLHLAAPPPRLATLVLGGGFYVALLLSAVALSVRYYPSWEESDVRSIVVEAAAMTTRQLLEPQPIEGSVPPHLDYECGAPEQPLAEWPEEYWKVHTIAATFGTPAESAAAAARLQELEMPRDTVAVFGSTLIAGVQSQGDDPPAVVAEIEKLGADTSVGRLRSPLVVSLRCTTGDEEQAQALFEQLESHRVVATAGAYFHPPWEPRKPDADGPLAEMQASYRRLVLHVARELAAGGLADAARAYAEAERTGDEASIAAARGRLDALKQRVTRSVAATFTGGTQTERRLIRGYLRRLRRPRHEWSEYDFYTPGAVYTAALRSKNGANLRRSHQYSATIGVVRREGKELVFPGLLFTRLEAGLPALGAYLCAHGCTEIRYAFYQPPQRRPSPPDGWKRWRRWTAWTR